MTVELMTREQLLELAALDALGLLDEYEAALYNRSFHDAPAAVQDEIQRLQALVANDETLRVDEEPDPSLRARVLAAVAKAIEREDSKLAPLATIGRRGAAGLDAAGPFPASSQFWRAAAFVLAGVGLVMAYFFASSYQKQSELTAAAIWNDTVKLAAELEGMVGTRAKDFLLDDSTKIALHATDESKSYRGSLFANNRTGQVLAVVDGLPKTEGEGYVLRVVLEDGTTEEVGRFRSPNGGFGAARLELGDVAPALLAAVSWWQITDLAGTVLLTST